MTEVACENNGKCDTDQRSFKAYLSRWMGYTCIVAPWTREFLDPLIKASAQAAAKQCNSGPNQTSCGLRWIDNGKNDGSFGVGEQMAALEIVQSLLYPTVGWSQRSQDPSELQYGHYWRQGRCQYLDTPCLGVYSRRSLVDGFIEKQCVYICTTSKIQDLLPAHAGGAPRWFRWFCVLQFIWVLYFDIKGYRHCNMIRMHIN
jgi:hypothetical protein